MIDNYVTGGSGFIGSHLLPKLEGSIVSVSHLGTHDHYYKPYKQFFWLGTYGNMVGQDDQFTLWQSNILQIVDALDNFLQHPPYSPFLFMSSSSVTLPVQTPYSRTKRAIEEILLSLPTFPACIVRPYSVTGVGEQKEHLIPTLIRSCIEGTPMDFVRDATHDFVDVEDVVNGLLVLSKIRARGVYEFGNGIAYTNDEVRNLVEVVTGKKANIRTTTNLREYDNPNWCCNTPCEYWTPTKPLLQSIEEMVREYHRERA